jgi:electron transport complex protein RnfG
MNELAYSAAGEAASAADGRKTILVLSMLSALCGLLIVGTAEMAKPWIAANHEARLDQAIAAVVPGGVQKQYFAFTDDGPRSDGSLAGSGDGVYAVYNATGALQGLALEASAPGYQDTIRILYGYEPERQVVTGITVMESRETPGLGDRITSNPAFLANFQALDATVDPETGTLAHAIAAVAQGGRKQPWEIDGISGATFSAKAVADMINGSLRKNLPRLRPHLDTLRKAPS